MYPVRCGQAVFSGGLFIRVEENILQGTVMTSRILVAYASRSGSTAEIAQAVGKELTAAGYAADVAEMNSVASLSGYSGIVIGAPLYMGGLVKDAGKFVGRHKAALATLPVAAFAVGISPKNTDAGAVSQAASALLAAIVPVQPVASVVFAGRLDPSKLSFIQRKLTELVKSPVGDFRDWDIIAAWARTLPQKMGLPAGAKD
jgi:menaquinone-dependent protoporphyrinogen oxidase